MKEPTEDEMVDSVISRTDMSLNEPQETVKDREAWHAVILGVTELDMA